MVEQKNVLNEVDQIVINAVGFDEFEYMFDQITGQPHSGLRMIIRDHFRDLGIPALKYPFLDRDEYLDID